MRPRELPAEDGGLIQRVDVPTGLASMRPRELPAEDADLQVRLAYSGYSLQ